MELEQWLQAYLQMVQALFGERICCVGLQGSYGRGEAGADSDIDVVLILDRVSDVDLKRYRQAADRLQQREKLCGFVSGRVELELFIHGRRVLSSVYPQASYELEMQKS